MDDEFSEFSKGRNETVLICPQNSTQNQSLHGGLECGGNHTNQTVFAGDPYYFYETEQLALLWTLLTSILVGNACVVAALYLSKSRRTRTNFFIMHLAIADTCVGLISVLTDLIWKLTVSWNAGNILCKVVRFAQTLVTYSSTYVLVALSLDRYDAITHPMNFSGSWRRAKILVIAAWALSVIFASPSLYLFEEKEVNGVPQCWIELKESWHWQVYMVLISFLVLIFPTMVISACYAIIVYTIWSKAKVMTSRDMKSPFKGRYDGRRKRISNKQEDTRRASSRGLIPKAKVKSVKMTFVIVFVFVLCWSPYIFFDLLQVFGFIPPTQTNIALATFIQSLAPLNSAVNPIIYCLFSTHLCRNLRKIKVIDQAAKMLAPFCSCTKSRLGKDNLSMGFSGTDYTSMSISSSKRSQDAEVKTFRHLSAGKGLDAHQHRNSPMDIQVASINCNEEKCSPLDSSPV